MLSASVSSSAVTVVVVVEVTPSVLAVEVATVSPTVIVVLLACIVVKDITVSRVLLKRSVSKDKVLFFDKSKKRIR